MLTLPYLKSRLHYDPLTGIFTWKTKPRSRSPSRDLVAGCRRSDGYITIGIGQERFLAHRLAYFYMTGKWPPKGLEIDHINGIRSDDKFKNLRVVTKAQNRQNTHAMNNKNGYSGVHKNHNGFIARLTIGTFSTPRKAHLERMKALKTLFPERFIH